MLSSLPEWLLTERMSMSPLRKKRLEASILRELAQLIIRQQAKDDRIEFVAVKEVELRRDFSSAKVQLSLFGTPEGNRLCYAALQSSLHRLQSLVGRNLRLRFTPRLLLSIAPQQSIDEIALSDPSSLTGSEQGL